MKGIVQITGETGVGKSSFAQGYPGISSPNDIAVFNFDAKPYPDFKYGFYRSYLHMLQDLTSEDPELAMVNQVIADFEKAAGKRVVIFDAWEIFSKGLLTYTLRNSDKFKSWIGGGKIARMAKLGHASRIEVAYLDAFMSTMGAEVVFIINHLTHEYDKPTPDAEGVRTGRKIPESSERLQQKASARFWLKHNPDHPCPIAVVLKDPGVHKFHKGKGIVPYRAFPDRLSPKALGDVDGLDVSIWDIIAHYEANPVGARILHDYERATEEEFHYVAGTLTASQRKAWENNQKLAMMFGDSYSDDLIKKIKEAAKDGVGFVEVYKNLKEDYPNLTIPQVKETMSM